jgi:hypothetical protein
VGDNRKGVFPDRQRWLNCGISRNCQPDIKKSGKNPVNFFPALYPVKLYRGIIGNFTSDAILSGTNAIVLFKSFHLVDIKVGKEIL